MDPTAEFSRYRSHHVALGFAALCEALGPEPEVYRLVGAAGSEHITRIQL